MSPSGLAAQRVLIPATNSHTRETVAALDTCKNELPPPRSRNRQRAWAAGRLSNGAYVSRTFGPPRLTRPCAEVRRNEESLGRASSSDRGRQFLAGSNVFSRESVKRGTIQRATSNHANRNVSGQRNTKEDCERCPYANEHPLWESKKPRWARRYSCLSLERSHFARIANLVVKVGKFK
jgi:hypothetical protein